MIFCCKINGHNRKLLAKTGKNSNLLAKMGKKTNLLAKTGINWHIYKKVTLFPVLDIALSALLFSAASSP